MRSLTRRIVQGLKEVQVRVTHISLQFSDKVNWTEKVTKLMGFELNSSFS